MNLFSTPIRRLAFKAGTAKTWYLARVLLGTERMEKFSVLMGIIVLGLSGCQNDGAGPKPSTTEVEPALKTYLTAKEASSGSSSVTINQLSVTGVGDFSKDMGGWPVYAASFVVTHHQGVTTITETWHPSDSNKNVAVAFARRTANGTIECFMPEFFQKAEKDMNSAMQKAFDNIQIKK
jgi:hypothetical protein